MAEKLYTKRLSMADHTQFGGIIYSSDFHADCKRKDNMHGSTIARRIASDQKFDEKCRKNLLSKLNYGGNQNA